MSEEEIIKELDKVINNNKDRTFQTGELNYVAMAESCRTKILDLQNQLQQKENKEKDIREYIKENDNKEPWKSLNGKELLEILDKEVINSECIR